jgi:hypothetical protein
MQIRAWQFRVLQLAIGACILVGVWLASPLTTVCPGTTYVATKLSGPLGVRLPPTHEYLVCMYTVYSVCCCVFCAFLCVFACVFVRFYVFVIFCGVLSVF